jgi:hypothetical protein
MWGGDEEYQEKCQRGQPVYQPNFEPSTPRIKVYKVTITHRPVLDITEINFVFHDLKLSWHFIGHRLLQENEVNSLCVCTHACVHLCARAVFSSPNNT